MKGAIRARCHKCCKDWPADPRVPFCSVCGRPLAYRIDIHHDSYRIRISHDARGLPIRSWHLADQVLHAVRYEITQGVFDPSRYVKQEQTKFLFPHAWNDYLEDERNRPIHKGTLEGKKWAYKHLEAHLGAVDIRDINEEHLAALQKSLSSSLRPKTVRNVLGVLHHFMRWAKRRGRIHSVPLFPVVHVPKRSPLWLDEETQARILEAIPEEHRGIFMFCAYHGARPGEARALKWDDLSWSVPVRMDNSEVVTVDLVTIRRAYSRGELKETKTGRERKIILHPVAKEWILSHRILNPENLIFCKKDGSRYRRNHLGVIWRKACQKVGLEGVRAYEGTRHSFASQHVSAGGSIYDLKEVLGHSDIRTTMVYAHSDLRASLRVIGRRGEIVPLGASRNRPARPRKQGQR